MWQDHTPYEEAKHLKDLQQHASFVWQALQKHTRHPGTKLVNNCDEKATCKTENIYGVCPEKYRRGKGGARPDWLPNAANGPGAHHALSAYF